MSYCIDYINAPHVISIWSIYDWEEEKYDIYSNIYREKEGSNLIWIIGLFYCVHEHLLKGFP